MLVSADGVDFTEVLADQLLAKSPGGTYVAAQSFDLGGNDGISHVRVRIDSNHGDAYTGLAEVMFTHIVDPMLEAPAGHDFGTVSSLVGAQANIPVSNGGPTRELLITSVTVAGADAGFFTVDSYPASLAAGGGSGDIVVGFDPEGYEGPFGAVLEITSNHGGAAGTVTEVILTATAGPDPAISVPASVSFPRILPTATHQALIPVGNLGLTQELAITSVTVTGNDAARFSVDSFPASVAASGSGSIAVTFDPGGIEGDFTAVLDITCNDRNVPGTLHSLAPTTARHARWEAATSIGFSHNLGGAGLRFLDTPAGWLAAPAVVVGGATACSNDYALDNAVDGDAGRGLGIEYASQGFGAAMFVDFDLGSPLPIAGFDFFDRIPFVDRTTAFDLLLSDDPTFTTGVTTLTFSPGAEGWAFRRSFAPVTARHIRFDATATTGPTSNSGMQEIIFYTTSTTPPGTPCERFITGTWGLTGADAAPGADHDGDGLANAIEFVLGSDPTTPDPTVAPTGLTDASDLVFTHRQNQAAAADHPTVQHGSDLAGWTAAADGENGITITTTPDGFGAGIDAVTVRIPRALAVEGRLFARLAVQVALTP